MTVTVTVAVIVAAFLLAVVGPALTIHLLSSKRRLLQVLVRHRVVLSVRTGETFTGILDQYDRDGFLLVDAEAVGAGERGGNAPVDGRLLVLREDVAYIQLI